MRDQMSIEELERQVMGDLLATARRRVLAEDARGMFHPHTLLSLAAVILFTGAVILLAGGLS